jgi:aminoglycoside 6'-N-acetyltransferase
MSERPRTAKEDGAPVLQGERVTLRPLAEDHLELLKPMFDAPEVSRWWGSFEENRLDEALGERELTMWLVEAEGRPIGLIQATEELELYYRNVELDIFLVPSHQGRGLGPEALRTALRFFFHERGHHRASIVPAVENERAIRSYERVGFKPVGVLRQSDKSRDADGRWRDSLMMDMLAEELT